MINHSNINNEEAYFKKVRQNMNKKDRKKRLIINDHENFVAEIPYDIIFENIAMEQQVADQSLIGWIELIENQKLYEAIKSLSLQDQIFLSYIIKEEHTQDELAQLYGVTQPAVNLKFKNIKKMIVGKIANKIN